MTGTIVAVGIAVALGVLFLVGVAVGQRARRATRAEKERSDAAAERLAAANRRIVELESELASVAHRREAEPLPVATAPAVSAADLDVIDALWRLERLKVDVQRQRDAAVAPAPLDAGDVVLAGALESEIERIREEMGTPGEMHSDLAEDPDSQVALIMLGAAQLTLGALARRCEHFVLYLTPGDGRVQARIDCESFEPGAADELSAAIGAVATAMAPAEGTAVFRLGGDGGAQATLSVVVP